MDGIIVINKPQGMTSHDVVSFLRKKTGVKRIGHSGTLDPMATGVLPVFIGKATRIIEYSGIPGDTEAKVYRCTMKLGVETDTMDIWGTEIEGLAGTRAEEKGFETPGADVIAGVLKGFEGPGAQRPPMYSAVKVGGRKLYEYARKGQSVGQDKIREREIFIKHIYVNHIDEGSGEVCFDVHCSKGVYIRTLCSDAGKKLGCGAALSALERLRSDGFSIEGAWPIDSLNDFDGLRLPLLPIDAPLGWMTRVELDEKEGEKFSLGQKQIILKAQSGNVRVYRGDVFLGIGSMRENALKPEKVLV